MGDTTLIHAVKGGHRSVVEALLKKYADVDIPGKVCCLLVLFSKPILELFYPNLVSVSILLKATYINLFHFSGEEDCYLYCCRKRVHSYFEITAKCKP